jgi:cell wall assembly regulator SMI1
MTQQQTISDVWARFVTLLAADAPQMVGRIRPPVTVEALAEAEKRLNVALPEDMRRLYLLADGFVEGAFLLRDDYRILPLSEMVEASLALINTPVITYFLAGKVETQKSITRLLFASAKENNPDVSQVSLRLHTKQPSVELWYREGGIHTWGEVVNTHWGLAEWLDICLEYYA